MTRRILAMLCVLALMLGMVNTVAFAADTDTAARIGTQSYTSLQAAVDAYGAGVITLEADAQDVTVEKDTYLDLNGHDIENVTVTGGTLYCMDSRTDDYSVSDGVYGKLTGTVSGNVAGVSVEADCAEDGYLMVAEAEGISFHRVKLQVYAMSLRAGSVGVYYKSHFIGDEVVAGNVQSFGVALSVVGAPTAENMQTQCGYSRFENFKAGEGSNAESSTGTLLYGIMKPGNTDAVNSRNADMSVYGRPYIKTADGLMFGAVVSRDLRSQVEAVDGVWSSLLSAQKATVLEMYESYGSVMAAWNIPNIKGAEDPGVEPDDGVITLPISVTAENGVVTEAVTVSTNGITVTVPAGVKLANGASELTVTVTPKETSDAGLTLEDSQVLIPMDVHVDGISADNTVPLTIHLGKIMPENLNMGNYTIYHVENGMANEMTLVAQNAEFTAHNQYKYTLDGEVTLYMATFSEVAAVANEENVWNGSRDYSWYDANATELEIRNADQLAGFGAIVGGMDGQTQDSFNGKTVTLLSNINLGDAEGSNDANKIFYPIGYYNTDGTYEKTGTAITSGFYTFEGTFDGNGNTISNFYQNTWEMKGDHDWYDATLQYYRDGMGLFGKVYGGTVKNLTVENFSSDGEITTTGVIAAYADSGNGKSAIFENITIFNCNPRVYNIGNGGIVGCAGWYSRSDETATGKPVVFRNITVDQTNKISALWGTYDVSCGGILGQYYPDSACGLKFENCHVAAIIDVNNDVCANYQYYWYRYSGMLMGTVRANTTDKDGYTVADTTGIEVTDCTYTYGSWNEYWYCELVKNSSASYTHDYQFSRLTNIDSIDEIMSGETWLKEGNFALVSNDRKSVECYHIFKNSEGNLYRHFHDQPDESNDNNPYEAFDVNGDGVVDNNDLKEDRQRYYLPFGQVLNGLGYGVKPTYEMDGFTLEEDGTVLSGYKFKQKAEVVLTYRPGQPIKLSDLVELVVDKSKLSQSSLYAAVSPVTEDGVVSATYSRDVENWENNSIVFSGDSKDAAKLVITDYFYCTPTVIYLSPETAAPKFEAKNVDEKDAYTQITLGELFTATVDNIGEVTATVTDPNGSETTVTGTADDWASQTIDLTREGEWTVVIKDDDAFCEITTVTFTVNKVDKFNKKFNKDFLYRVGNENAFDIGYIFGEDTTNYPVKLSSVTVDVENIAGNATGGYTADATWTSGDLKFTNSGIVEVTISADGVNAVSLYLEVVAAENIASAKGTTTGGNFVLLQDVNSSNYVNYWDCEFYGNGFTYSLNGAPTAYNSKQGHGILITKNAVFDNVVIIGDVYNGYGAYSTQDYYNTAIDAQGKTVIQNSYIANCSAPIRAKADVTITDSTLYGGAVANLLIESGVVTLENVVTANYEDGRQIVGLGIVAGPGATDAAKLVLNGTLTQYNFISEANKPKDQYASTLYTEIFDQCEGYYFGSSPNRYINTGVCSMSANFTMADVDDNANTNYDDTNVTLNSTNGFLYSQKYSDGMQVNNGYDKETDSHIATVQGAVEPAYKFDYTTKNNYPQQDGSNDYCFESNGKVNISMDSGDTFNWDTAILSVTKIGETLSYTVTMNDTDYTGKSIAFNTAGNYTVEYTYTDPYNYRLAADGSVETYEVIYTKVVPIVVSVAKVAWKNAEIKVTNTAMSGIYVMSGDYDYSYKMKFLDCITITDYDESGNASTVTLTQDIKSTSFIDKNGANPGKFDANSGTITVTYNSGKILTVSIGAWSGSGPSAKTCSVKTDDGVYIITDGASNAANTGVTWKITGYTYTGNNGAVVSDNTTITFTWDTNSEGYNSKSECVSADSLVTLADGTQIPVEELTGTEQLLVWNLETGAYDFAPIVFVDSDAETEYEIVHLYFSDGTDVEVIAEHGFFDTTLGQYVYLDRSNAADYIGHSFVKQGDLAEGTWETVMLTDVVIENKVTTAYSPVTFSHLCYYVDGMLSMPGGIEGLFNIFEVDAETMAYDAEKKAQDIETYGLFTYEDFADLIPEEAFYAFDGAYLKVAIGKGMLTWEDIEYLAQRYVPLM